MGVTIFAKDPDGVVYSYPKTGRTWLRFMLAHVLAPSASADMITLQNVYDVVPNDVDHAGRGVTERHLSRAAPLILMSHKVRRKMQPSRSVLLLRHPADVVVSHWFHAQHHYEQPTADLCEFMRSSAQGLPAYARFLDEWATQRHRHDTLLISYESMTRDTFGVLSSVVNHLMVPSDDDLLTRAVRAGQFDRMRSIELEFGLANHSYDRSNAAALRVREGKVGGHAAHFGTDEWALWRDFAASLSVSALALLEDAGAVTGGL